MNYIKHLTGFFNCIVNEETIYPTHISLYLALFQSWNINRFKNPIAISRDEMMKASRIASKATYHKCIKELQLLGFIQYLPSYNPYSGTEVIMHNLSDGKLKRSSPIISLTQPTIEQVNGRAGEQVIEPHIYNNKQTFKNNKNISIEENFEEGYVDASKKEKKSSAKKKEKPGLEEVKEYFKTEAYPELEAERFFNYYTSNGWLIGGKTEMVDWNAAARNWMLTTSKFSINSSQSNTSTKEKIRANNLHIQEDKDYTEPL